MLREIQYDKDREQILVGTLAFINSIQYAKDYFSTDPEILINAFDKINDANMLKGLVYEIDGRLEGGMLFCVCPHLWNPEKIIAEEICWWVYPDAPRTVAASLLFSTKKYLKQFNVNILHFRKLISSPDNIVKAYNRLGLNKYEESYLGII